MIFSPEQMWQCAVKQMGLVDISDRTCTKENNCIVLHCEEDVAELYKALQEAHWKAITRKEALLNVADYEREL